MTVTLCDICRKEIDMTNQPTKTINRLFWGNYGIGNWLWHSEYDLCSECGKSLNEWINARKKAVIIESKARMQNE